MQHFESDALTAAMKGNPVEYLEFLRVPELSCGIYHLKAGEKDPQQPHDEGEIYYVLSGGASFTSADETVSLKPGSILYVAAEEKHRFHDVTEDLTLLVVFAAN